MPAVPNALHIYGEPIEQVGKSAVHRQIAAEENTGLADGLKVVAAFADGATDTTTRELPDVRTCCEQAVCYPNYPIRTFAPQDVSYVCGVDMVAVKNLLGIEFVGF